MKKSDEENRLSPRDEAELLLAALDAGHIDRVSTGTAVRVIRGLSKQVDFLIAEVQKNGPLALDLMQALANSVDAECVCSVPDFVCISGEPESGRCLRCGKRPPMTDTVTMQLLERRRK